MINDVSSAAASVEQKFNHCNDVTAREEITDERFRSRQPSWTGLPTSSLNRYDEMPK